MYLPHIKNFFDKSLYVAAHFAMVPGYMTKKSMEFLLKQSGSATPFAGLGDNVSWKELVENQGIVIGGSPATVVDRCARR